MPPVFLYQPPEGEIADGASSHRRGGQSTRAAHRADTYTAPIAPACLRHCATTRASVLCVTRAAACGVARATASTACAADRTAARVSSSLPALLPVQPLAQLSHRADTY